MVTWDRKRDLIEGEDPMRLEGHLSDLESSPAWAWICRKLAQEADSHSNMVLQTIEPGQDATLGALVQKLCNHNRNMIVAKTLACIPQLVRAARAECKKKLGV